MKIGVVGGKGKLGSAVYSIIQNDDNLEGIIIESTNELLSSNCKVDVYIDCTTADAFMQNYQVYKMISKPIVIATTGFSDIQSKYIYDLSKILPIIKAANFSIGVYKYLKIIEYATALLGDDFKIGIIEKHHEYKKDRPSGTAKEMMKVINKVKPNKKITAESVRLFDIVGQHELYFYGLGGETLEISHRMFNRQGFASGALAASKWIITMNNGLYSMEDMLR